ncbi:hypothetical protein C3747_45g157 [Trypanosoma cruzi]|uniref:Uncharacterized protein n=2 Tax=Trypanosoma cruzi TaxID=5693 RepID=Q4E2I8_TRYCC|nr:hypothetical protein, conserved [Trypanosoma cruzi]EAN98981.1 hypothetical protein, conserved [Trypanosoma cruzi]PWV13161.1 hypothetical protein C3747_45g157 [Trypanosoma cruzi]RNC38151.1 hypothetical protein TcCL_NonESM12634 [Trypanosoma cruzi]|eukprot:XP_820832.1 hypothetical protein [Trypanosoma cruzi strain CL Brener]
MEIRKTTENVLAIADDVIALIANGCPLNEVKCDQHLNMFIQSPVSTNRVDKAIQTEYYTVARAVQHCNLTKSIAVQNISLSADLGTQTDSSVISSAVQTEPDMSHTFIQEAFKKANNIIISRFVNIEEMWMNLLNRLHRFNLEFRRLSTSLDSVRRSRDFFEEKLRQSQWVLNVYALVEEEIEARRDISEEEQGSRYNIALMASCVMIGFHRECEKDLLVTRNELIEKLNDIDALRRQLSDIHEGNTICTTTDKSEVCNCVSEKKLTEHADDLESTEEMKRLLTECWVVLGQDI